MQTVYRVFEGAREPHRLAVERTAELLGRGGLALIPTFDRIDRLWRLKKAIFRKTGSLNCHAYLLEKLQKKDDHVDFTSTYILSIIQTNVRI